MRIKYEDWSPKPDALRVIAQATDIAASYQAQGYDLTLRQLYYQFVARDLIPNQQKEYKRLGDIINKARLAGLFDWSFIVDRTRNIAGIGHYASARSRIRAIARYFPVDHWQDQPFYVEVWVEKEALAGVVGQAAEAWDAPYFSCRGYVSQSELWGAAQRLGRKVEEGKRVLVLHLGDHDPSGIDMTRDIQSRLNTFTTQDFLNRHADRWTEDTVSRHDIRREMRMTAGLAATDWRDAIEVERIALNMDQVEEYQPPPNPAKVTDSRFEAYQEVHGDESWELDALEPSMLDELIQSRIQEVIDFEKWQAREEEQERERARLQYAADRWDAIVAEYDENHPEPHPGLIDPDDDED